MMNLMQVDAQKTTSLATQASVVVSYSVQIIAGVILIYNFVGISVLAGAVAIIIGAVIHVQLGKRYQW